MKMPERYDTAYIFSIEQLIRELETEIEIKDSEISVITKKLHTPNYLSYSQMKIFRKRRTGLRRARTDQAKKLNGWREELKKARKIP